MIYSLCLVTVPEIAHLAECMDAASDYMGASCSEEAVGLTSIKPVASPARNEQRSLEATEIPIKVVFIS